MNGLTITVLIIYNFMVSTPVALISNSFTVNLQDLFRPNFCLFQYVYSCTVTEKIKIHNFTGKAGREK